MESDPGKAKKIRAGHRVYTNKLLDRADEIVGSFDGSESHQDRVEQLTVTLNEKLSTLKGLDEAILLQIDEKAIEKEIVEAEEYRASIHERLVKLKRCKRNLPASSQESSPVPTVSSQVSASKLPRLLLSQYNGDPKRWNDVVG